MKANILLSLCSHRTLALARWDLRLLGSRIQNIFTRQSSRIATDIHSRPFPLYLNIGCGPKGMRSANWVNIDAIKGRGVDYAIDLTRKLPFPAGTFDGVFCEHVIEHFSATEIPGLLRETWRIMKPGAALRIIVHDGRWIMETYLNDPASLVKRRLGSPAEGTAMQAVNSFFRQRYEHQFIYDYETIEQVLLNAGFSGAQHLRYGLKGSNEDIILDDISYEPESLYVEAFK